MKTRKKQSHFGFSVVSGALVCLALGSGCTKNDYFRLNPAGKSFGVSPSKNDFGLKGPESESFDAAEERNAKVDLLWIVDNSASMEPSQEKLRRGFVQFARKYMRPNWDIRVAVITTDAFIAHPAFQDYLQRPIQGTVGLKDSYVEKLITGKLWTSALTDDQGVFFAGIRPIDEVPVWGREYSRLRPGNFDGPTPSLCYKKHGRQFFTAAKCSVRDDASKFTGPEKCVNPGSGSNQKSIVQCVNTVRNNTVRSGRAIIETIPPTGTAPDEAWEAELLKTFIINVSVGTAGSGSERGMGSLLQVIEDNQGTDTELFRPGSQRIIAILSDENDQTMEIPHAPAADFNPERTGYLPEAKCTRTAPDGKKVTVPKCPDPALLTPVASVKARLDEYFSKLDGGVQALPYVVAAIVPVNGKSANSLQDSGVTKAQDWADRYIELAKLAATHTGKTLLLDIGEEDYTPVLDEIGAFVTKQFNEFQLKRVPAENEDVLVRVVSQDGSKRTVPRTAYEISGLLLKITDKKVVSSLRVGDQIQITYRINKAVFAIDRLPGENEALLVKIIRKDGTSVEIPSSKYRLEGSAVVITDQDVIDSIGDGKVFIKIRILRAVFTLDRLPESNELVQVTMNVNGAVSIVPREAYRVEDRVVTITDESVILRMEDGATVTVTVIPKHVFDFDAGVDAPADGEDEVSDNR